jgi:tetratricopeptide (TPR) repeat protein
VIAGTGRRALVVAVVAFGAAGCGASPDESVRRFEAERVRWHLDRFERRAGAWGVRSQEAVAELRRRHVELAARFGPEHPVEASATLDPEVRLRYRIAGSSALYAAELAARDGTDESLREEFASLAERYAFDPEIAVRSRIRAGLAWERDGNFDAALASYRRALDLPDADADSVPAWERLRGDLELHVVVLEHDGVAEASDIARGARDRLARRAEAWSGRPGERWIRRRLAEVCAVLGDGDEAARILLDLVESAAGSDEGAELQVRLGEVQESLRGQHADAEACYRRAGAEAAGRPAGIDARLHLAALLHATDRPREGADVYAVVVAASVAPGDPARVEALWGRGRCWDALGRWEDAIPAFSRATHEEGPFAIAAAARLSQRFREIGHPKAEETTRAFVERAGRPGWLGRDGAALRDWASARREDREWQAVAEVLEELGILAARGTALADSARAAQRRVLEERARGRRS